MVRVRAELIKNIYGRSVIFHFGVFSHFGVFFHCGVFSIFSIMKKHTLGLDIFSIWKNTHWAMMFSPFWGNDLRWWCVFVSFGKTLSYVYIYIWFTTERLIIFFGEKNARDHYSGNVGNWKYAKNILRWYFLVKMWYENLVQNATIGYPFLITKRFSYNKIISDFPNFSIIWA